MLLRQRCHTKLRQIRAARLQFLLEIPLARVISAAPHFQLRSNRTRLACNYRSNAGAGLANVSPRGKFITASRPLSAQIASVMAMAT